MEINLIGKIEIPIKLRETYVANLTFDMMEVICRYALDYYN